MKKTFLILLFLSITFSGFSQEEKKHKFTHTLTENIGLVYKLELDFLDVYPSIHDNYSLRNLIPSYELGYNNKFFLRLKYRNLTSKFYEYTNTEVVSKYDAYSIAFSYNLYDDSSPHSVRFGAGYYVANFMEKTIGIDGPNRSTPTYDNRMKYSNLLLTWSYVYKLTPHFSIGTDIDFYNFIFRVEGSVALSYTF